MEACYGREATQLLQPQGSPTHRCMGAPRVGGAIVPGDFQGSQVTTALPGLCSAATWSVRTSARLQGLPTLASLGLLPVPMASRLHAPVVLTWAAGLLP